MDVELPRPRGVAEELEPAGAVDEVEEDQLAHLAASHDAARQAPGLLELGAGVERLGRGADRGDLLPVGEPLRTRHGPRV